MELKKRLVIALAHTISCVALHRRLLADYVNGLKAVNVERLAFGASQSNDKPFFKFHRVYIATTLAHFCLDILRKHSRKNEKVQILIFLF